MVVDVEAAGVKVHASLSSVRAWSSRDHMRLKAAGQSEVRMKDLVQVLRILKLSFYFTFICYTMDLLSSFFYSELFVSD